MAELTPEQEVAPAGGRVFDLPPVDGPCWTSDDGMAISREWIAFRATPRTLWSVVPYSAVSSLRRGDYGGIVLRQADGFTVKITMTVVESLEACELLAEGLGTNPALAAGAARLLQPRLDAARARHESSLARAHTVDRSGTTHTFSFHRGQNQIGGVLCAVMGGAIFLVLDGVGPFVWHMGSWRDALVGCFGLVMVWLGIRAFRGIGVQVSGQKVTIRNERRTRTVSASEIRAITLEPKAISGDATHWVPRVELSDGSSIWIDNFDGGPASGSPRPDVVATLEQVRALLAVGADDISIPDSPQPGSAAAQ